MITPGGIRNHGIVGVDDLIGGPPHHSLRHINELQAEADRHRAVRAVFGDLREQNGVAAGVLPQSCQEVRGEAPRTPATRGGRSIPATGKG